MYAASGSHDDILELLLLQVNFTFHRLLHMTIICILDLVFPRLEVEVEVSSSSSETYDFWCVMAWGVPYRWRLTGGPNWLF